MSLDRPRGWFADVAADDEQFAGKWVPHVQTDFAGISGMDIAFDTREDCEWFIREHLIGQGWMDGPMRYRCPDCEAEPSQRCVSLTTGSGRVTFHADRERFRFGGWPS